MNEKTLYYLWLSSTIRPGSKTPKILLEHFGSIEKIFEADKGALEKLDIPSGEIQALTNKNLDNAKRYYEYCVQKNVSLLVYESAYYPERLKIIDNPPPLLYFIGTLSYLDDNACITMVGTRSCSERGFRLAYETAFEMATKGAVIVNGLALGIDGACIAGALDAGGYAVGVLGCGIDRIYPYGNKDLFERLETGGLILTEFPPFSKPCGANFPVRNRVISALSVATVVFEADSSSGALITAHHAVDQGRRIFAVPAKPYDKNYSGALELIREGASVFTRADDVLSEYSMSFPHRINLDRTFTVPKGKEDLYISKYFKKDVNPDSPVNRRFTPNNKSDKPKEKKKTASEKEKKDKANFKIPPTAFIESKTQEKNLVQNVKEESISAVADVSKVEKDISVLSPSEREVYKLLLKYGSLSADEIAQKGLKIDDILSTLTLLEIYELVRAVPGGKYEMI